LLVPLSWRLPDRSSYTRFLTIQDDPFIVPCHLLALPVQYQPAEPQ
jgi:hypothetical protein